MSLRPATHRRTLTLICLVCAAVAAFLHAMVPTYRRVENVAGDWLMTNRAARLSPRNPELVYLGIDEASRKLDTLFDDDLEKSPTLRLMKAGYPYHRGVYAAVAERLAKAGARAVVFDIIFDGEKLDEDPAFRAALDQFSDRVVVASSLEKRLREAGVGAGARDILVSQRLPASSLIPPESRADPRVGFANVRPDEADLNVRRVNFRTTLREYVGKAPEPGDEELRSLAARALEKAGYADRVPETRQPLMLRFSEEIPARSLHEIFVEDQWNHPPYSGGAMFKDKIVLIGAIGLTSEDRLLTPFGATIGPAIHLSAINAALNGDFLHETSLAADLALIFGAGGIAWLLGAFIRQPFLRLCLLAAALVGYYALVQFLFNTTGFFPALLSPLLALGVSGITWSIWQQVLDVVEKARLRRTFERYVSRDVVKELVDNPQGWLNTLGGQRKMITVLFSDVRGFTTITESGDAQALVSQLNEYFNEMVNIVFRHQGTLDKFIGDAVMAQWGGIVSVGEKEDACRAVRTAVEMRDSLARLNAGWEKRGMLQLQIGIGVNHGEAIVGNLGAEVKKEVTAIGDAVNTASRLEGMTKPFHADLLIGETLATLVRERFFVRSVALTQPKGKMKPVDIFTVIAERASGIVEPPWMAAYEEGVRCFRARDFAAAISRFEEASRDAPGDWLIEHYYLGQCRALIVNPPPPDWTPVDVMTSK